MRIIKGTETIPVEHPVFLVYGQPGIGKSTLGYSCKNPLTLDFDKGVHRAANRRDTLLIDSWADVVALNREVLAPYDSVIADTVGRCLDLIVSDIAETDPKKAPGGNPTLQGYGLLKTRFRNWMAQLRSWDKDVLLIAHDKEDKDGDTRIVRPDVIGGSYAEIMKVADFVAYLYMSGKDRLLDFNPTDRWVGKNPAQWKPVKLPAVAKAQHVMEGLFDDGRKALGGISEESAKVMLQVDDWRTALLDYTTAEECNGALADIQEIKSPIVKPQVETLFRERVKALGLAYSKRSQGFKSKAEVDAEKAEAVPA